MKITSEQIQAIKSEKIILNRFKVKKIGENLFQVFGFLYGREQKKMAGDAAEVAKWINQYFGLTR